MVIIDDFPKTCGVLCLINGPTVNSARHCSRPLPVSRYYNIDFVKINICRNMTEGKNAFVCGRVFFNVLFAFKLYIKVNVLVKFLEVVTPACIPSNWSGSVEFRLPRRVGNWMCLCPGDRV